MSLLVLRIYSPTSIQNEAYLTYEQGRTHQKIERRRQTCHTCQAEAADKTLFANIVKALKGGDAVVLASFGSFKTVKRAARKGRNSQTGAEIQIPASTAVKFSPAKALKESL